MIDYLTRQQTGQSVQDIANAYGVNRNYPAYLCKKGKQAEGISRQNATAYKPHRLGPEFEQELKEYMKSINYEATYREVRIAQP